MLIQTDNKCAEGLANNHMRAKESKSIDMRYHWIKDRVRLGDFQVVWQPGSANLADYLLYPVAHVRGMRHHFVSSPSYYFATRGVIF